MRQAYIVLMLQAFPFADGLCHIPGVGGLPISRVSAFLIMSGGHQTRKCFALTKMLCLRDGAGDHGRLIEEHHLSLQRSPINSIRWLALHRESCTGLQRPHWLITLESSARWFVPGVFDPLARRDRAGAYFCLLNSKVALNKRIKVLIYQSVETVTRAHSQKIKTHSQELWRCGLHMGLYDGVSIRRKTRYWAQGDGVLI